MFLWQWDDLQFICISNYSWIVSVNLTSHYLGFELVNSSHFNLLSLMTRYKIRFSGCSVLLVLYFMVFGGIHFECVSMTTIGDKSGTMQRKFHVLLTSRAHIIYTYLVRFQWLYWFSYIFWIFYLQGFDLTSIYLLPTVYVKGSVLTPAKKKKSNHTDKVLTVNYFFQYDWKTGVQL